MENILPQIIADYLGFSIDSVIEISTKAPKTYRRYSIPKKNNQGVRIIHHPAKQTKAIQYALIEVYLNKFPIHECAIAYKRKTDDFNKAPILLNALKHKDFAYSVRIDFTNFFHSISPKDLFYLVKKDNLNDLTPKEKTFLSNALFININESQKGLAIGAPSSPLVSNIVMYGFDEEVNKMSKSISIESVYTRYADDIVFSTNEKGKCREFANALAEFTKKFYSPSLKINPHKTIYMSRGTKRVVTGIVICPNTKVSLGRKNKKYVKKLIFDYKSGRLDDSQKNHLRGWLAFILDVEPGFYNRLVLKYTANIVNNALKGV